MKTYKITASTTVGIALRDANFNGRTSYDVATGLTMKQAKARLKEMFLADYPKAFYIETEEEFEDIFGVENDNYRYMGAGYYDINHSDCLFRGMWYKHEGRTYTVEKALSLK